MIVLCKNMRDVRLAYICLDSNRNVPAVPPRNDPRAPRRHCVSAARAPGPDPKVWQHALDAGRVPRRRPHLLPAQRPCAQYAAPDRAAPAQQLPHDRARRRAFSGAAQCGFCSSPLTSSLSVPLNSRTASYRTCEGTAGKRKPGAKRSDKPCVYVGMLNEIVCISPQSVPTDVKGQLLALLQTLPDAPDALRSHLERAVCRGDNAARGLLQALLPLTAFSISIDTLQAETEALLPHIGSAPDLYPLILQAIARTNNMEDRLVMLMRTCFLFFPPSRRIQKRTEWEIVHGKSLVILLRACLPTLLSLFPQTGTKDVLFDLRVLLFRRWYALLAGTHEQRVAFFTANSSLLRVCLIEYFYYYVMHVHPMPKRVISADKIALLARNATNIGQHLRMELNKASPYCDARKIFFIL